MIPRLLESQIRDRLFAGKIILLLGSRQIKKRPSRTANTTQMRQFINQNHPVPTVKSPISQAVVVGKHGYISGQLSTDWDGNYVEGTVLEEAERAFQHIFTIAEAAGFERGELVFIDVAFLDLKDLTVVNTLFLKYFDENKMPARTVYQAAALPYGGKIKITAIAIKE